MSFWGRFRAVVSSLGVPVRPDPGQDSRRRPESSRSADVYVPVARARARCYSWHMPDDPTYELGRYPERAQLTDTHWPDVALDERFRSVDKDLVALDVQIRAVAPLVKDVSGLQEAASALRRDVTRIEDTVKGYVNRSVTKQLVIVSTPLFFGAAGLMVALLSGKLG